MANWSHEYYRSRLRGLDLQVYDAILRGWRSCSPEVVMPSGVTPSYNATPILEYVAFDHPEIFWVNYFTYHMLERAIMGRTIDMRAQFNYFCQGSEMRGMQRDAEQWRQRILSQIDPGRRTRDKVWMLYDYLSRQVTYGEKGYAQSHTIIGCMLPKNHVSVCEGISKGFKFLCDGLDLPCITVVGHAGEATGDPTVYHAWNIVQVSDGLRHLDVTGELTRAHADGIAPRSGFLHSDDEMRQYHYRWNTANIPACR